MIVMINSSTISALIQQWKDFYSESELQMGMDMPMSFHMFDVWAWLFAFAAISTLIIVSVYLFASRPNRRMPPAAVVEIPTVNEPRQISSIGEVEKAGTELSRTSQLRKAVQIVRPTVTDDERRILNEIVKAGGEILQSDLSEKSDFSKATITKLIKSLETMGIITRQKHKWTYWVRLSEKLISRTKNT